MEIIRAMPECSTMLEAPEGKQKIPLGEKVIKSIMSDIVGVRHYVERIKKTPLELATISKGGFCYFLGVGGKPLKVIFE